MDSANSTATRIAAVLLRAKSHQRLARFVLALLPDHDTLRAFHSLDPKDCSLPAVLDLGKRLTPKRGRAEVISTSRAIVLATYDKPAETVLALSRLQLYMPRHTQHKMSWATYHALTDVVVPASLRALTPLLDLNPQTLQLVFSNSPHISAAVANHYPQHEARHMVRLMLALVSLNTDTLRVVLQRLESHPGFTSPVFPKAVLTIASRQDDSVADVLEGLLRAPETCETVLSLVLAGTPGYLYELQAVAAAILQQPELRPVTA